MLRKLGFSFFFLSMMIVQNVYAIVDSGPAINGTPSQFAVYALEDLFTYKNASYEGHMEKMKNAYFSEQGWKEFQAAITKNGFISRLPKSDSLGINEYWIKNSEEDRYPEAYNKRKNKFNAEFVGPMQIIWMKPEGSPPHPMNIRQKSIMRVDVKLKMSASKDPVRKYGSHFADDIPAYHYRIESFEFVPRKQ